jgi:hypothetical protein
VLEEVFTIHYSARNITTNWGGGEGVVKVDGELHILGSRQNRCPIYGRSFTLHVADDLNKEQKKNTTLFFAVVLTVASS